MSPHPGPLFADENAGSIGCWVFVVQDPSFPWRARRLRGLLSAVFSAWGLGSSALAASSRWTSHEGWRRGGGPATVQPGHRPGREHRGHGLSWRGRWSRVSRVPENSDEGPQWQEGVARGLSTLGQSPTCRCLARVVSSARWPFPRTRAVPALGLGNVPGSAPRERQLLRRGLSRRAVPPQVGCVQVAARVSSRRVLERPQRPAAGPAFPARPGKALSPGGRL